MQISITTYYDEHKNKVDGFIEKSEWISYIKDSALLSNDTAPTKGRNPITGTEILIAPQPDVAYFQQSGKRVPIQYNDGDLWTECEWESDSQSVLTQIANHFGAVLLNEDGEVLTTHA